MLGLLCLLFAITLFLAVLAPIPLTAAGLHLGARRDHRRWRGDDVEPDPRLGFVR